MYVSEIPNYVLSKLLTVNCWYASWFLSFGRHMKIIQNSMECVFPKKKWMGHFDTRAWLNMQANLPLH